MVKFSPLTTLFFGITFLMVFFCSCTITKRRYNSGFHIEWKNREKVTHSVKEFSIAEQKKLASKDTLNLFDGQIVETKMKEADSNKIIPNHLNPILIKLTINQKRSNQLNKNLVKNEGNKPIKFKENHQFKRALSNNMGLAFLMVLPLILFIPPLLFTLLTADDYPTWKIVTIWVIWIAGIVAIALLLSNIWVIIGLCLAWNVIYTIAGVVLVNLK